MNLSFLTEFWQHYSAHTLFAASVIATVLLLRFLTTRAHRFLVARAAVRFPDQDPHAIDLVRSVLDTLWLLLGLTALTFLFVSEGNYGRVTRDFKLVLYVGTVAVATIVGASIAKLWFEKQIRVKSQGREDTTGLAFFRYVAVTFIYVVGALFAIMAFPSLRGIAQTALGGAGVIAVIAGVGSQEALANLVGGVFIILFKPFRIGDTIEISGAMMGSVVNINLRHTVIKTYQNKMIIIPNAIINKEKVINYDFRDRRSCDHIEIGISYDSNVARAKSILGTACEEHPLCLDHRTAYEKADGDPLVKTALTTYNDSSVTIRAWVWSASVGDAFTLRCDVLELVKARFAEADIELPYPYRTVVVQDVGGAPLEGYGERAANGNPPVASPGDRSSA